MGPEEFSLFFSLFFVFFAFLRFSSFFFPMHPFWLNQRVTPSRGGRPMSLKVGWFVAISRQAYWLSWRPIGRAACSRRGPNHGLRWKPVISLTGRHQAKHTGACLHVEAVGEETVRGEERQRTKKPLTSIKSLLTLNQQFYRYMNICIHMYIHTYTCCRVKSWSKICLFLK